MLSSRLLVLAALATGASASALAAEQAPAVPDWKQSQFEEGNPAVRSVYILAVCARNHRRAIVEAMLATEPDSAEESRLIREAVPSGLTECPIRAEKVRIFSEMFMRGALAEAIYNGDKMKPRTASLPFTETFADADRGNHLKVARWTARCAVRRNPKGAHQVVSFNPGAVGERRALLDLRPTFLSCLPAGERLEITRLKFRAMIAEELYRASNSFKESFSHA